MDILSHTFSGVAAVSLSLAFTDLNWKEKTSALLLGALVGAFPDLDAVSLWSGFGEVGSKIYTGKLWYSHHGFNHSLVAGLLFVVLIMGIRTKFKVFSKNDKILSAAFFVGFFAHLVEDMPTPFSHWGGVRLFFPSEIYVGGFGKIWWWNNYDIFLLIVLITVVNLFIITFFKSIISKRIAVLISSTCIVCVILFQINTRHIDYNYVGSASKYMELEKQSKIEQKRILGDRLYGWMLALDNQISLHF